MQNDRHHEVRVARQGSDVRLGLAVIAAATLGVAGFLIAGTSAQGAIQSGATVSLRTTKLGAVLVNAKGRTLYLFAKDKNGKSACTATCATYWPPLVVKAKPTAGPGVKASLLGTTMRSDGRKQVTYNHHPLYGFTLDKQAGQVNGEGSAAFGARWWAVSARGAAVTKVAAGTTTSMTTTAATTTTGSTTTSRYP
jgi:predicted lipoprotein with Yx(FWY)xxD motif